MSFGKCRPCFSNPNTLQPILKPARCVFPIAMWYIAYILYFCKTHHQLCNNANSPPSMYSDVLSGSANWMIDKILIIFFIFYTHRMGTGRFSVYEIVYIGVQLSQMRVMASRIISTLNVCWTASSGQQHENIKASHNCTFWREILWWSVHSPTKGQWGRDKMAAIFLTTFSNTFS